MDTEMTDPSVDITTPAAIGANPTAIGDSEAGPSGVQKRQKVAGNECSDTIYLVSPFNEAEEVILSRMKFHLASQRRLVPDVALGEVYQQMKLGMESFSDWWKQLYPVGTYEDDIQRGFEMYRLNMTQADVEELFAKHADHLPFTLHDLELKRKAVTDAVRRGKRYASTSRVDEKIQFVTSAQIDLDFDYLVLHHADKGGPNEHIFRDMHGKTKEELTPEHLDTLRDVFQRKANNYLVTAQDALDSCSKDFFWHTFSCSRPPCVLIGAGAVNRVTDTSEEKLFKEFYECMPGFGKEGLDETWVKNYFATAAHPRFDDNAIKAVCDMFPKDEIEGKDFTTKTGPDYEAELRAKRMEAQERWRAALGVPLDFDDHRKNLLSKLKEAKAKYSHENRAKRRVCYVAAVDKKIALYQSVIARLFAIRDVFVVLNQEEEEIYLKKVNLEIDQMEALLNAEKAKKDWKVLDDTENAWEKEDLKKIEAVREELNKHLNSITRRQYLFSKINNDTNPWLDKDGVFTKDTLNVFKLLMPRLKPHEIANFREGIKLKPGADYNFVEAVRKVKMAKLTTDPGKPLSEGAEFFFNELALVYTSEIYEYMQQCTEWIEEITGKKLRLIDVVFDVNYFEGDGDTEPHFRFYVHALVQEEVEDILSEYKKWVSGGRKGTTRRFPERCSGQYHVIGGNDSFIYFCDGDGFNEEFEFEGFMDSFSNYKYWSTSEDWDLAFSVAPDGTVTQRKFVKTDDGRSTFPLVDWGPYNPVDHPYSLEEPTTEW
jgi:hypothetical protein